MLLRKLSSHGFRAITGLFLSSLICSAQAADWAFPTDHGYQVDLIPSKIPQKSGTTATTSGTITFVGTNGLSPTVQSKLMQAQLVLDQLEIHAYFPDMLTEVTSQVKLTAIANGLSLSYQTPALATSNLNTLIVQVKHASTTTDELQLVDAKLKAEILVLNLLIDVETALHAKPSAVAALEAELPPLQTLDQQTLAQIATSFNIAAETHLPLQVDNTTAQASSKMYVSSPFRYTVQYDLGSAIQGESANASGLIELVPGSAAFPSTEEFVGQFSWNGNVVKTTSSAQITTSTPISFSYSTGKLSSSVTNVFTESLTASLTTGRLPASTTVVGSLALDEPVAPAIAPVWASGSTPDSSHPYVQNAQAVSALVQDTFGRIDPSSFHASLQSTISGSTTVTDISSSLTLFTPDSGQSYQVTGSLNPLAEGAYTLSYKISDLAGNVATSTPVSFVVNRTAPVITFTPASLAYTDQTSIQLSVSVQDSSPVDTIVSVNGTQVAENKTSQFQVNIPLQSGANSISITSTDAAGNSSSPQGLQIFSVTQPVMITLGTQDNILTNQASFTFPVTVVSQDPTTSTVTFNGAIIATSNQSNFNVSVNLNEGVNTFQINTADDAGNTATSSLNSVMLNNVPPSIILGTNDNQITRLPSFSIPITVTDISSVSTVVTQNGSQIDQSSQLNFVAQATLSQGQNIFQITSTDAAGNQATALLSNITFDNIPPVLSNVLPVSGSNLMSLNIPISGQSNEALSVASVNGQSLTLSSDAKSFFGSFNAQTPGNLSLDLSVSDLAGNTTEQTISLTITLTVLNGGLLSVAPDSDGTHLDILGAQGAAEPGVTVNASASYFNTGSAVAASDGSFKIQMAAFTQATVTATDPNTGMTTSANVSYGSSSGTLLSGTVKDTSGNLLPGVTVSLQGNSLVAPVTTNSSGIFTFQQPATGDQVIIVDGTTIPQSVTSGKEQFSAVRIAVNVGVGQSNVLQTPIYLAPLMTATATPIPTSGVVQVTDANAPGVSLNFDSSTISFPNTNVHSISMSKISANYSTIPPFAFSSPGHVIALEPSGTTFSQPVQLTLSNDNNLPTGTDVVIMSMNSLKGIWEIGGIGTVSSGGQSIVTKAGMGITHFSIVYASPLGPQVSQIGSQDIAGADTFNGAVSTHISMPSYKTLGASTSPELIYKSSWAKPTALVTDLFNIPPVSISFNQNLGTLGGLVINANQTGTQTYIPNFITGQFFTDTIASSVVTFQGIPTNATVSYATELKDPSSGQYLASGVYPFESNYQVHLNDLVVGTTSVTTQRFFSAPQITQTSFSETIPVQQAFPSDLVGPLFVQNKVNSAAGRGWKIAGVQQILNPTGNQLLLEESDGAISSYNLNNTISTVADGTVLGFDLTQGSDLNNWPIATVTVTNSDSTRNAATIDLSSATPLLADLGKLTAQSGEFSAYQGSNSSLTYPNFPATCNMEVYPIYWHNNPQQLVRTADGTIWGTSQSISVTSSVSGTTLVSQGSGSMIFGLNSGVLTPSSIAAFSLGANTSLDLNIINGTGTAGALYHSFYSALFIIGSPGQPYTTPFYYESPPYIGLCAGYFNSNGVAGISGLSDYANTVSIDGTANPLSMPGALFNNPIGITPNAIGQLVVADTGNNIVRVYDPVAHSAYTIAGTGQNYDSGDNGPATSGSMFHPQGLAYDSLGNLYISTANGYIREVDNTGMITTFAGLPSANGGVLANSAPASQMVFNNPFGLVVDNLNGYLYVADTGNNRIVRIDFATKTAINVAGTGNPGYNGDNQAALAASLSAPTLIGLDSQQNLLIADSGNNRIRRVVFQNVTNGTLAFSPTSNDNSTLVHNPDGTWMRSYRNGTNIFFDATGRQYAGQDRIGRTTNFTYNGNGNLTSITDPTGHSTQYNYSGNNLGSIQDPAGRITSFNYDGNNNLTAVAFPNGTTRSYTYDPNGLMLSETDQVGATTQYTYNAWNRLATVTRADSSVLTINDSGSATASNNYVNGSVGQLQTFGSSSGQVSNTVTDAESVSTQFVKDDTGYISTVIDGLGRTTTIQRDLFGDPTLVTRPDQTTVTYTYDPVTHDLLSQTDSATGITTSQTYDKFGNLITQTNGRGYTSTSNYDPVTGLLMATADPLGHGVSYSYNNLGLQIAAQNSVGLGVSNITYDSFGNPSSVTDTANHPATYTRDSAGNVLTVTDAKGQVTQYTYDSFNHLLSVTTPKNEKTFYAYTPTGHVHQITDPFGNVTTFQYNALGQLVQTTDPLGMVSKRAYDANGNLAQETDPNGNVKTYSYDAANRLIKKTLPDDVISLSYDTRNSITQAANSVSAITFNYDDDERLTSVQSQGLGALINNPSASLSFNYDQDNDLVQLTDPVGASCYSYDAADRLNSLRNPKGEIYSFGLDAGNRLTSISRPGSQTSISYDTSGFMSSLVHLSGGTSIDSFTYQRDAMGNVNQITTPVATRTLAYDPDSQLTLATNPETTVPSMQGETFSYDQISNRTQDQSGSYNYDQHKQRLVQDYRYNYFYDNNGNLNSKQEIGTGFGTDGIAGEVTNYFYSSQNQLTGYKVYPTGATTGSPSKEVSYSYDALGRRIQKQVTDYTAESDPTKTFTRRYVYDGQQILLEYDGNNDLLARYTYSNLNADDVLAVDVSSSGVNAKLAQNSGTYLYLKDQLGSVVDIADTNGNKIQHYIYSAFGQLLGIQNAAASDVTSNPPLSTSFTFTGREHDSESGFYFYRARYYDPNTGRFLQKDPSPGKLSNASSVVNSYIYALNNPGNRVDPTGKFSFVEDVIIAVVAVSVAVAAVALAPFTLGGSAVLGGIVEGALVGALAGGATGAEINLKDGRNWSDNIGQALAIGAVAGGAAGGITGALSESSMISVQSVTNLSDLEDGVTSDYGTQTVGVTTDPNVAPFGETQSQQLDELAQNMHVIEITIEDSGSMAPIVNPLCIGATLPMMIVGWITGGPVGGVGSAEVAGVICQTVP